MILRMLGRTIYIFLVAYAFAGCSFSQSASPSPTVQPNAEFHRWVDVDVFSISTRYRFVENANHRTGTNQQQWQFILRGRFKFDRKGHYSVYGGLASGNTFTGGWNNTGWGTGNLQTNL